MLQIKHKYCQMFISYYCWKTCWQWHRQNNVDNQFGDFFMFQDYNYVDSLCTTKRIRNKWTTNALNEPIAAVAETREN